MRFLVCSIIVATALLACAGFMIKWLPSRPTLWRELPRERAAGTMMGICCLVWASVYVLPMLEGGMEWLRIPIMMLLVFIGVFSIRYLEYLFTRALGGLLILVAMFLLHEAFVAHAALRPACALVLYLLGTFGIVIVAVPYRFRDLLRKVSADARWRSVTAAIMGCAGIILLLSALLPYA